MDEALHSRCYLLFEFEGACKGDDVWSTFFEMYDVGVPLAMLVVLDFATPSESGVAAIQDTWNELCRILGLDPEREYESFDEMARLGSIGPDE